MALLGKEPSGAIGTMEELFAIAAAMEREAIEAYAALATRMRQEGREDLAPVFARLAEEKAGHLGDIIRWSKEATGKAPDASAMRWHPDPAFGDEGASVVAPELLSAYKAFSAAVRNEERAFAFWSYLAASSPSDALRAAAERMAHDELSHVAALRRERRRAFHRERAAGLAGTRPWSLAELEERLSAMLSDRAKAVPETDRAVLERLSAAARARAEALVASPLGPSVRLDAAVSAAPRALTEALLDVYLDLAERLSDEAARARAQRHAGALIDCLSAEGL